MPHDPMTMFCYCDLSGQLRGKGFPSWQLEKRLKNGIGWTPNNIMFTALGAIAPGGWGSYGDVMFVPDEATRVEVDFEDGTAAERFYLSDIRNTDGTTWDCCPRTLLKNAIRDLRDEAGLVFKAAFEHEFIYFGANGRPADAYALDAVRRHGAFGEKFLGALAAAGVEVDSYLAEFAEGQFEITVPPAEALRAADTAVIVKEMARATAWRLGHRLSFAPRVKADGLGSGVHIHFSLWNDQDHPVSHDPNGSCGMSEVAGQFLSGIVRHMPALCAFTAPTPVSYLRLVSHSWTGVWSNVGLRDREAGLRICPTFGPPEATARQFNFEYRPADATANPYLQVALLIRAGLSGIRDRLPPPKPTIEEDPETMSPEDRAARNVVRLPTSADAALAALEADESVKGFLPPRLLDCYLSNKRHEFDAARGWSPEELCRRYSEIF